MQTVYTCMHIVDDVMLQESTKILPDLTSHGFELHSTHIHQQFAGLEDLGIHIYIYIYIYM